MVPRGAEANRKVFMLNWVELWGIGSFALQNTNVMSLLPKCLLAQSAKAWDKESEAEEMRSDAFCISIMDLSESLLKTVRGDTSVDFGACSMCLYLVYVAEACCSAGLPWRYTGFLCKLLLFYGQQLNGVRSPQACLYKPHIPHQDLSCEYAQSSCCW